MNNILKIWYDKYPNVKRFEIEFSNLNWVEVIILRCFIKLLARKANPHFASLETF